MKKTKAIIFIGFGIVLLAGIVACNGAYTVKIGVDQDGETALIITENTSESAAEVSGEAFRSNSVTGPLTAAADQVITINFTNGIVDQSSIEAGGIVVSRLADAANANTAWVATALNLVTVIVIPNGIDNSIAYITVNLSGAQISDPIEVFLDATLLTAAGGLRALNGDQDFVGGEDDQDDQVFYVAVSGATVTPTTGANRDPLAVVTIGAIGALNDGDTTTTQTAQNSLGGMTRMTTASLTGTFTYYLYDPSTHTWVSADVTPSYDSGTGDITHTIATAVAEFEIYRVLYDTYMMMESAVTGGYTHRAFYDQMDANNRYSSDYLVVGPGALGTIASAVDSGNPGNYHIDVTLNGTEVIESTISASSIRVYNATTGNFVPVGSFVKTGNLTVTLIMPEGFDGDDDLDGAQDDYRVIVYPELQDDAGTPADATDDIPYGSTGTFLPGDESALFTF